VDYAPQGFEGSFWVDYILWVAYHFFVGVVFLDMFKVFSDLVYGFSLGGIFSFITTLRIVVVFSDNSLGILNYNPLTPPSGEISI